MWLEVSSATLLALAQDVPLPLVEALQPSSQTYPALSPDGTRLLFSSGARGALNLYILELDTGSTVTLTDGPTEDSAAVWSPDGLQIVFQREEANGNRDLWIISADGAAEKNITNTPTRREQHPAYSGDGSAIYFDANLHDIGDPEDEDRIHNYDIYRLQLSSGTIERLTQSPLWDMYPSSDATGNYVVWRGAVEADNERGQDFEVMIRDVASGNVANLTQREGVDTNPNIDPTGSCIVFASDREASRPGVTDLFLMDIDGSNVRRLTNGGGVALAYARPQFSRDGQSILANRIVAGHRDLVRISAGCGWPNH